MSHEPPDYFNDYLREQIKEKDNLVFELKNVLREVRKAQEEGWLGSDHYYRADNKELFEKVRKVLEK